MKKFRKLWFVLLFSVLTFSCTDVKTDTGSKDKGGEVPEEVVDETPEKSNDKFEYELSFDFIDIPEKHPNAIAWRGLELGDDGLLYTAPYEEEYVLIIDPKTDVAYKGPSVEDFPASNRKRKWVGITKKDGRLYLNPHLANGFLVIDTSKDPVEYYNTTIRDGRLIGYGFQTRSSALYKDTIYTLPYTSTFVIRKLDTSTDFYAGNTAYKAIDIPTTQKYWGAAIANKKIYGIPLSHNKVLIYDIKKDKAFEIEQTIDGGRPNKGVNYVGAVLSSINNNIYAFPRYAETILKINTKDDTLVEIPLPQVLIDAAKKSEKEDSKSFHCVEGPHGRIYSTPWRLPYIFWIDPRTDEIGYQEISEELKLAGGKGFALWYTYAKAVEDSIYFAPAWADKVMKITVDKIKN